MKRHAILLTLSLLSTLAQAEIVCSAQEMDESSNAIQQIVFKPAAPYPSSESLQWEGVMEHFRFQVYTIPTFNGPHILYSEIRSLQDNRIIARSEPYFPPTAEEATNLRHRKGVRLTYDRWTGYLACHREDTAAE
jgi:hypothetical protein